MFKVEVDINKSDYMKTNRHYLKKYLGVKEYVLLGLLIALGIALYILTEQLFIIILTAVTIFLLAIFLLIFNISGSKLYKAEYVNRKIGKLNFSFEEDYFEIEVFEEAIGEEYTEKYIYPNIEKAAILKDRIYIYLGAATMYYIKADSFTEGNFVEFCDFMKKKLQPHKFKMKNARFKDRVRYKG